MPEWRIERGIGESRMVRIEAGEIVEARILIDGVIPAGTMLDARLTRIARPTLATSGGQEYLLPKGAPGMTEGGKIKIEVTREVIPGPEPWKRPLARATDHSASSPPLTALAIPFPAPDDALEAAGWSDLLDEARSGMIAFPGGLLRVSPTPAMTLFDVDGTLPMAELALAAAQAAARAILRHSIGGSIGIDLPTIRGKGQRTAVAEAIDAILPPPFERTAVNGFGFIQIVRPRTRASLFEIAADRALFEARALLRRAARETGAIRLAAHPAVIAAIEARPNWTGALAGQVGGAVGLRSEPSLAMAAGYAEKL